MKTAKDHLEVASLKAALAERDRIIAERDQTLVERSQRLLERDQLLAEREKLLAATQASLAESDRLRQAADLLAASYKLRLDDLIRRMYGPSSEKVDPKQMALVYESVRDDAILAQSASPEPKPEPERQPSRGGGRRPAPQNLPVERIVIDVPETERPGLIKIREEVTEEIDYLPSRFIRRQYVRPVYASPDKTSAPLIGPLPPRVIPQSGAGVGLLAHLVVARFADHLPYYRQEQIYARSGLDLPRQKLSRWAEQVALLLQGLQGQLQQRILQSGYCQADETPVKVIDAERPGAARDAWLWTYHAPEAKAVVFDFQLSRGRDGPRAFIPEDWRGILQTDGYQLYAALGAERPGIILAGCLAHARRKWIEALDGGGDQVALILADFAKLYRVETEARAGALSAASREVLRRNRCEIVLDQLRQRIEVARTGALPQSRIGLASHYTLSRWATLTRFAQPGYGHIEIDNNPVENAIRPTALGKKNWLFIGHPDAGWKSAVLYSLLGTCKLLGVNPERYLVWVLPQLAAATNQSSTTGLLPHDYAATVKEQSL